MVILISQNCLFLTFFSSQLCPTGVLIPTPLCWIHKSVICIFPIGLTKYPPWESGTLADSVVVSPPGQTGWMHIYCWSPSDHILRFQIIGVLDILIIDSFSFVLLSARLLFAAVIIVSSDCSAPSDAQSDVPSPADGANQIGAPSILCIFGPRASV